VDTDVAVGGALAEAAGEAVAACGVEVEAAVGVAGAPVACAVAEGVAVAVAAGVAVTAVSSTPVGDAPAVGCGGSRVGVDGIEVGVKVWFGAGGLVAVGGTARLHAPRGQSLSSTQAKPSKSPPLHRETPAAQ
jgi:hypothetical protein